jgi:hypothetical protein
MKKLWLLFLIIFCVSHISYTQTTLSSWGFENVTLYNAPYIVPVITEGSSLADDGILITGSAFDGYHPYYSTVWSTPVGNGSSKSLSSNYWSIGNWYVFLFRTTGYQNINITWDQTGNENGPRDFKVQYSIDGSIYTDATGTNSTYSLTNDSWVSSTYNLNSTRSLDLSSITSLNNQNLIYIKFTCTSSTAINGGTIGTTGTSSIDNFRVSVTPLLSVAPNNLEGFTYMLGSGPSSSQSYNLSGINLTGFPNNITVSCLTNYEISTDNTTYSNSVNVPYTSATLSATPIYVRLKTGLSVGTYNGETISNTGGGATTVNVTCSGEVTPDLKDVVITEINDHPTSSFEYVELYNNSQVSVDLTGWSLIQQNSSRTTTLVDYTSNVFEGSLILSPGEYAIIFRGSTTDFNNFKLAYNITGTINAYSGGKIGSVGSPQMNGTETFRLQDNSGNLIDYFGDYNGGASPLFSLAYNSIYERKDYPNDGALITHWYTLTSAQLGGSPAEVNENPLPVELTSFSATTIGSNVKLIWKTETEVNNFGFDIERSVIKDNWSKIGFVKGNGNSNSPKEYSFNDNKLIGGSKFIYRLKQIDNDGQFEYSNVVEVKLVPTEYALYQNYPNPFNPTTKIRYQLPQESKVVIKIYNVLGSEVMELLNEQKEAGIYEAEFNSDNLSSGTYIYRIIADNFVQTKKMILLK